MSAKLKDLLERTAWTAVQAFFGVWAGLSLASESVEWNAVLYSAGVAALIAAAKCIIAFNLGDTTSASLPEVKPENTP
jgi:hypothetical protein